MLLRGEKIKIFTVVMWNMMRQIRREIDKNWKNIIELNMSSKSETNLKQNIN